MSAIAVAIPHAGNLAHLRACLDALEGHDGVEEIVVVTPASAEDSRELVEGRKRCTALVTDTLWPFAAATNLAARNSRAAYLLLLNDDTEPESASIEVLAAYLDAHPDVGIVVPRLAKLDGTPQPSLYDDPGILAALEELIRPILRLTGLDRVARSPRSGFPSAPESVDWASGAAMMIRRRIFDDLSGVDERFEHGMEDAALCRSVRDAGFSVMAHPGAVVRHRGGSAGFRSVDPERLLIALSRGARGWETYLATFRPSHIRPVLWVLRAHAAFRWAWYLMATLVGRGDAPERARAYGRHLRTLLRTDVAPLS